MKKIKNILVIQKIVLPLYSEINPWWIGNNN